ncbi:MAG TPA: hypothetical protein VG056_10925 [Pirellulales bacterium]|jgi:hypothetical protein|nr:hypothetical protein [Pirellulales bacterium]
MKRVIRFAMLSICFAAPAAAVRADEPGAAGNDVSAHAAYVDAFVARMMAFSKSKDGNLSRQDITDDRLLRLFDRIDAKHEATVTKEQLVAFATKLAEDDNDGDRRGPGGPGGGPGGPGGDRGGRGGGPGGRFGGWPPRPGQILPDFLQERLNLTADQKKQVEALQKEVDAKLAKILTDEQKKQLKEMRNRGPGGNGPPPGPPDENGPPRDGNGPPPGRPD